MKGSVIFNADVLVYIGVHKKRRNRTKREQCFFIIRNAAVS